MPSMTIVHVHRKNGEFVVLKVVLFDIDGTLMSTDGAGVRAMQRAFEVCTLIPDAFEGIKMAGKTDPLIIKEAMDKHVIDRLDHVVNNILTHYAQYLKDELRVSNNRHLKPGILEFLDFLHVKGIHVGLLTGNIEQGAMLKLVAFGINNYFPFGGFSSDNEDRNRLLPIALRKLQSLRGIKALPDECVVVGDTPRDVICARVHGAKALGVATGSYSCEALSESGADWVFQDLADTESIWNTIYSTSDDKEEA